MNVPLAAWQPSSAEHLAEMMRAGTSRPKAAAFDLRKMNRVLELSPEDMTVTVQAGIALGDLQGALAAHRQWLPIDPPKAATLTVHEMVSRDASGPRRFGYGTIREHLIGLKVMLADGRIIQSGGKVVKNVAGYDLAKLFIGARDSLGIITEATFKVRPLPEREALVGVRAPLGELEGTLRAVIDSALTPVILDVHRVASADDSGVSIVVGLAGTGAEVEWQLEVARTLGFATAVALDYETEFWSDASPVNRLSVLPSRLPATLVQLGPRPFVARAGNGVIYHRGAVIATEPLLPVELIRRIKLAYDPQNVLPDFPS